MQHAPCRCNRRWNTITCQRLPEPRIKYFAFCHAVKPHRSPKVLEGYIILARPGKLSELATSVFTCVCGKMASPSPSEFLTFYRTIRTTTTISQNASRCLVRLATTSRPFSSSLQQYRKDIGLKKSHTSDKVKKGEPNVQIGASSKG